MLGGLIQTLPGQRECLAFRDREKVGKSDLRPPLRTVLAGIVHDLEPSVDRHQWHDRSDRAVVPMLLLLRPASTP
jgi:hypothetical protein